MYSSVPGQRTRPRVLFARASVSAPTPKLYTCACQPGRPPPARAPTLRNLLPFGVERWARLALVLGLVFKVARERVGLEAHAVAPQVVWRALAVRGQARAGGLPTPRRVENAGLRRAQAAELEARGETDSQQDELSGGNQQDCRGRAPCGPRPFGLQ